MWHLFIALLLAGLSLACQTAPQPFQLLFPDDQFVANTSALTLEWLVPDWSAGCSCTRYELLFDSVFPPVTRQTLATTYCSLFNPGDTLRVAAPLPTTTSGTWYWAVSACNLYGCTGTNSTPDIRSFCLPGPPGEVNPPTLDPTAATGYVVLQWTPTQRLGGELCTGQAPFYRVTFACSAGSCQTACGSGCVYDVATTGPHVVDGVVRFALPLYIDPAAVFTWSLEVRLGATAYPVPCTTCSGDGSQQLQALNCPLGAPPQLAPTSPNAFDGWGPQPAITWDPATFPILNEYWNTSNPTSPAGACPRARYPTVNVYLAPCPDSTCTGVTATLHGSALLSAGQYRPATPLEAGYWLLQLELSTGYSASTSDPVVFTVCSGTRPVTPGLTLPAPNANNQEFPLSFSWEAPSSWGTVPTCIPPIVAPKSVTLSLTKVIETAVKSESTALPAIELPGNLNSFTLADVTAAANYSVVLEGRSECDCLYEWTLTARNEAGLAAVSETRVFSFCVPSPPRQTTLVSPPDLAIDIYTKPTLEWTEMFYTRQDYGIVCDPNRVNRYLVVIYDTQADLNGPNRTQSIQLIHSAYVWEPNEHLAVNTQYWWQVQLFNGQSSSSSPIFTFTTRAQTCVCGPGCFDCPTASAVCVDANTSISTAIPPECTCNTGWSDASDAASTNSYCSEPICTSPCENGGICDAPDSCNCVDGYTGATCSTKDTKAAALIGGIVGAIVVLIIVGIVIALIVLRKKGRLVRLPPPDYNKVRYAPFNVKLPKLAAGKDSKNFEEYILNHPDAVDALVSACPPSDSDNLAKGLVYFYEANGGAWDFVKKAMFRELERQEKTTMLRQNSLASRAYYYYARMVGVEYLFETLARPLYERVVKPFEQQAQLEREMSKASKKGQNVDAELMFSAGSEIDPMKMEGTEDENLNVLNLEVICQTFHAQIARSAARFPAPLSQLLIQVRDRVNELYNEEETTFLTLSNLIYLRFINPSLLAAENYGLCQEGQMAADGSSRLVVLIVKVMQNLANHAEFGKKEPYMKKLNAFINDNTQDLQEFYADVLGPGDKPREEFEVPDQVARDSLAAILRFCVNSRFKVEAEEFDSTELYALVKKLSKDTEKE